MGQEEHLEVLNTRIDKMKGLLIKAKSTINEYKLKADESEQRLEEEQHRAADLQRRLEALVSRPPPAAHEVASVQARVKVDGVVWMLVRKVGLEVEWYREDVFKVVVPGLPEIADYANSVPAAIKTQLAALQKLYEDRIKKLQDTNSQLEGSLQSLQKAHKDLQQAYKDREMQLRSPSEVTHLISESKLLHDQLLALLDQEDVTPEALAPIQQSILRFLQSPAKQNPETEAAKEHFSILQKTAWDLVRRLMHCRNELQTQEAEWRATCSALVSEKEQIKAQFTQVKGDLVRASQEHVKAITELIEGKEEIVTQKNCEIERLTKELRKTVNLPYLRNVVVQYLTSKEHDVGFTQVQERLIHVLATILDFGKEEAALVQTQKLQRGVLSRWLGT